MMGDPFEAAGQKVENLIRLLNIAMERAFYVKPCEFCGLLYVHHTDCLDRMNAARTPTGDWWKL